MPPTTSQRRTVASFVNVTQASEESAQAFLRGNNYNLEAALNQFYSSNGVAPGVRGKRVDDKSKVQANLNGLFDSLAQSDNQDELTIEEVFAYSESLNVNMGNYEFFVLADIVRIESFGQITRRGFVDGWMAVYEETGGSVAATTIAAQQKHVLAQIARVASGSDPAFFKKVYRSAFPAGRELGKKEMDMGRALALWEELFAPTMNRWRSASVDWFEAWGRYLREKFAKEGSGDGDEEEEIQYRRSVSKDLWNQTLLFAEKTLQDETLGFWSEEQAWPGVIDEFVLWCREKGVVGAQNGGSMEVE